MKKEILLFDLDGTLINSFPGIRRCCLYAIDKMGYTVEEKNLPLFVGPPLTDSFMKYCGMDYDTAAEAVLKYRELYTTEGIKEYTPYPGMEDAIRTFHARGKRLGVATSKPEHMAEIILEELGLTSYFDVIGGSISDQERGKKEEVLEYVLDKLGAPDCKDVVLIGDTVFDLEGANLLGVDCVIMSHGFGSEETCRRAAGCVHSFQELTELIS